MASTTLGTSSIALLPSRYFSSSSKPSVHTLSLTSGRKFYGGIGIHGIKGRSQFSVSSVATEVNSVEQNPRVAAKESQRPVYPFAAIVGQDEMKLCLLLNVIDPKIGGVMIMGDRGTGKSTTVRSLVDLLPEIKVVSGDPYNSDPVDPEFMGVEVRERVLQGEELSVVLTKINMVDLPLGATEDRVCGTIDIEKALTEGVKAFEPGLLAKANRGILYVDEVNLLDDHLVDVLLDSAASGWNTVEREGISISHPARFILIGSGNPEEGELRPQLLDRFGMHAQVGTVRDAELRVKIVEERGRFDKNPKEFRDTYKAEQDKLQDQITSARSILSSVQIDQDLKVKISRVCAELNVDGLRGDIVTNRAAKALAALKGRDKVSTEDIATVIPNCLRHRLRKDPLESIDSALSQAWSFQTVIPFTLCVGNAWGEAALLLASGAKGNRSALPSSTIMIRQPIARFQGQATDVNLARREVNSVKAELVKLYAKHMEKSPEQIEADIQRPKYFSPSEAVEYGIIDKVIYNDRGSEDRGVVSDLKRARLI